MLFVYVAVAQTHTIVVHPNNRVASLQMTPEEYQSWKANDDFGDNTKRYALTQDLYQKFGDDFDFIFYVLNEDNVPSTLNYYGKLIGVSNDIQGIGSNIYDNSGNHGSNGKLQAIMQLSSKSSIQNGPALHELMHNWGNYILTTDVPGHWGYTGGSGKGQLGGFKQSTLVENGNNSYTVGSFGLNANGGNSVPFTDLELYLMGLIPASDVEDFDAFTGITNLQYNPNGTDTFTAATRVTHNGATIVAEHGARVPDYQTSQKEFKLLTIVLTDTPLTDEEWDVYDGHVERFGRNGDNGIAGNYNFWEATNGLATLDVDNISDDVETPTPIILEEMASGIVDVSQGLITSGDIDGDGDIDLFVAGRLANETTVSKIYKNNGVGTFTEDTSNNIPAFRRGTADFGDVDGDNDLDLVVSGISNGILTAKLYLNDGAGTFSEAATQPEFVNVFEGSTELVDIDGDNDLDIVLTGKYNQFANTNFTGLYRNNGSGEFTLIENTNLPNVGFGEIAFLDVDGDNDMDAVISGETNQDLNGATIKVTKLYKNNGSEVFTEAESWEGMFRSNISVGDIDNDNDLDVIVFGYVPSAYLSKTIVLKNNGTGTLVEDEQAHVVNASRGDSALKDFDNDGDLDLIITGYASTGNSSNITFTKLYANIDGKFYYVSSSILNEVNTSKLVVEDIDGNGLNDLIIVGSTYANSVTTPYTDVYKNITDVETAIPNYSLDPITAECSYNYTTPPTITTVGGETVTGTTTDNTNFTSAGTHQITWNFEETSGTTFSVVQEIIIEDNTNPTIPSLEIITAECEYTVVTNPTTTDNCAGTITGETTDNTTFNTAGTYYITWIFDDGNGNSVEQSQTIVIQDTTDPVIPTLAPITASCSYTFTEMPTTTDNCAGEITGTTTNPLTYNIVGEHTITWTFDDGNGNSVQQTQTVTIENGTGDLTAPTLAPITAECSYEFEEFPVVVDGCAGDITGTTTDETSFTDLGAHEVTWTFEDGIGNSVQAVQLIIIQDTEAPEEQDLDPIVANCSLTITEMPIAIDECAGEITGTTTDDLSFTEVGDYSITWTFDDGNGNTKEVIQEITINGEGDFVAPVLETINANCSYTVEEAPVIVGSCAGDITGETSDATSFDTAGTHTITWTFDDGNGNIVESVQTVIITVEEFTAPTLETIEANCFLDAVEAPVVEDGCVGTITGVTPDDTTDFHSPGEYTITWYFDIGDGNEYQSVQTIIITGTPLTAPTLAPINANCSYTFTTNPTTEGCDGTVTGTTTDDTEFTSVGTYEVVWNFTDVSGAVVQSTQTITITDNEAPIIPTLEPITTSCSYTMENAPTTTDNCSGVITGETSDDLTFTGNGEYQITWTFTDASGNSVEAVQTVNLVDDNEAPQISDLEPQNISCGVNIETPVAMDNCSGEVEGTTTDDLDISEVGTYIITWTFEDENGNTTSVDQTIIIEDTEGPMIPVIPVTNAQCEFTVTQIPYAPDLCGGLVTVTHDQESLTFNTPGTHEIEWTFVDSNGNSSTAIQTVIIEDTEAPIIQNCMTDQVIDLENECDYTIPDYTTIHNFDIVDNCNSDFTIVQEPIAGTVISENTQVTLTVTDINDNVSTCSFNVEITDTVAPNIVCPETQNILAEDGVTYTLIDLTESVEILDNCEGVTKTQTPAAGTVFGLGYHAVTVEVVDAYGNASSCQFIVQVVDDLDVSDFDYKSYFELYPNPAIDEVTINTNTIVDQVVIFDVTGKVVHKETKEDIQKLQVSNLAKGVYTVQFITRKGGQYREKLVIR
ncbi:T9SS type A sorting domain-containing protein [Aureivirga marina]|uniref:T9SS type A sorting domain-containing protein n=1 Tax=Aureivirga marina TaxID=1182451 RepID=UPI0018CAF6A4|nr:T9SS type A sorting domain-containing protein [Aureivirga marina]